MSGATLRIGPERALLAPLALALLLIQTSCLIPVRVAPGARGLVVDAETGAGVGDAIVVVRFDGRHGDVLPDREVLGHREIRSDEQGRFEVESLVRAGISAWPVYKTDVRVVAVFKDGYRCSPPVSVRGEAPVQIRLKPARDAEDQRDSCRPVPADPGEVETYMTAWRGLFPRPDSVEDPEQSRELARILEARSVMGFGENCQGPVFDLALAPDGTRASYVVAPDVPEIHIVELATGGPRPTDFVKRDESWPPRRLAWTSTGDLVLWEPSADTQRSVSPSIFGSDRFEVIWRASNRRVAPPASPAFRVARVKTSSAAHHSPLEPADLNDEGDARWAGRSFSLKREMDPNTGLSTDQVVIVREDGTTNAVTLPGESCGPHGRFGRPHYRITGDGSAGIDLRFIEGGCHGVQIDFESGAWKRLDTSSDRAVCSDTRKVPASNFNAALRSYSREVERARVAAGGDPVASYALIIGDDGGTHVETRDHVGEAVRAEVPDFPIATPLRRIDVSLVSTVYQAPASAAPVPEAKSLEPL